MPATGSGGGTSVGQGGATSKGGATSVGGTATGNGGATTVGGSASGGATTTVGGATSKGGTTGVGGATNAGGGTAKGGTASGGAATGGVTATAGAGTRPGGCAVSADMISDFEEGAGTPAVLPGTGVNGKWEMFHDTGTATQSLVVESSGDTTDCKKWALHTTGSGWATYVGIGLTNMAGTATAPAVYPNTKSYTGIKFRAKVGSSHPANSPVRVNISTPETEETGTGGKCTKVAATAEKAELGCYQHVGRYLQGDFAITTAWKDISLCFDRDLYPLSLPSNLTNAQRDAVASNILKVQFQFNLAKDWTVSSYPDKGKYTDIPKTTAFDFWIDDLQFFTGDCPNNQTFTSTAGTAKPFPQNKAVGSCAPATNAAKYNTAITQAYARWKTHFVKASGSNAIIVAPEQTGVTTSEAMGYGMLIAAAMGDKDTFQKFWGYVQTQLTAAGNTLMTWSNQGGAGSATDADSDIAYALLMADAQWGGYATAANSMAAAILASDVVSGTNVMKGGSQWMDRFNPSYFAPSYLRKFTGFGAVITKGYQLVNANIAAPTAGLPTDWADPSSGAPSDKGSAQVTSELAGIAYGYDAARVPWRIGMDVCGGATEGKSSVTSIINFFSTKYNAGASIDLLKAGWTKSSGVVDAAAANMQGSFIGPMGVAGMAADNAVLRDRSFRAILDILDYGDFNHTYFPSTVGMITLLVMSGNFPTP